MPDRHSVWHIAWHLVRFPFGGLTTVLWVFVLSHDVPQNRHPLLRNKPQIMV